MAPPQSSAKLFRNRHPQQQYRADYARRAINLGVYRNLFKSSKRGKLYKALRTIYVSQWHLSKLINRHVYQSFLKLLNVMRIDQAKALLAAPSLRVHAIMEEVGHSQAAHFSKGLKKMTGKMPGEFRASLGAGE